MNPGPPNPRPRKVHPPLRPLDPAEVARATDIAFQKLVHEIAGLVDGSLRYLRLAQRAMSRGGAATEAERQYVEAAGEALTQVAGLIREVNAPHGAIHLTSIGQSLSADRTLREIIEHAADVLRPLADERGVEIRLRLDASLDEAPTLPIYPVVANGLRNAIEATKAGGLIEIVGALTRDADERRIDIDILDDGEGPPAQHDRVFDPGFSTKGGSTGLGLAICQDLVDELGGLISLGARTKGGARLSVRLPIAPDLDDTADLPDPSDDETIG